MTKLQEQLDHYTKAIASLQDFNSRYGEELGDAVIDITAFNFDSPPTVTLRDPAKVGVVLGKHDWTRKPRYGRDGFDWERDIMGVHCVISKAEELPPLVEQPVLPKEFPILLEDQKEVFAAGSGYAYPMTDDEEIPF